MLKKISFVATIFICVALVHVFIVPSASNAAGATSIARTFQPSSADTYVHELNPTTNYGTDTNMNVERKTNNVARSIVTFDLSEIPTGSTISSATLSLYMYAVPSASRDHGAHRVTASWVETSATWDAQPASAAATATTATGMTANVWLSWTVTTDVHAWIATDWTTNYGWMIKDAAEGDGNPPRTVQYYTREYTGDTTLRPKLAITFTADLDSYQDTARSTVNDSFDNTYDTVYMKGTGFLNGSNTYDIGYYDNAGDLIATDNAIALVSVGGGRGTLGNTGGLYEPTYYFPTDPGATAGAGWHAVIQPSGATSFPATYATLTADPDTYQLIADDTFSVNASAIPEFPTVIAGIVVAGLSFWIYYWMKKRRLAYAGVTT